jgi:hypothetical protein
MNFGAARLSKLNTRSNAQCNSSLSKGGAMDYESRISKVEVQVEANQRDTDRLYQLVVEKFESVELSIKELREHTDQRIDDLRRDTDHSISELRKHTDQRIDDLRTHNDQQFSELRREITVNMRWVVALWITTIGLIAGLAGRVFGMY